MVGHRSTMGAGLKTMAGVCIFLALLLGLSSAALAGSWSDVDHATLESYGISSPDDVAQISQGYPDGRWRPWEPVTRAEFTKMAVAAFRLDMVQPIAPSFSDVPASDPFYPYVEGAHLAGLVRGIGGGLFAPDAFVTREQAIGMAARWVAAEQHRDLGAMTQAEITTILHIFTDGNAVSPGLRAEMAFAVTAGLIKGDGRGCLSPRVVMNRMAAAALLLRARGPEPRKLTEDDNGSTITLQVGGTVDVVLKGNPTTGYSWMPALTEADATILQQVGEPRYVPDSDLIGAGGTYTFTFKALKGGKATLKLVYLRPWESVQPLKTFAVTVQAGVLLEGTVWKLQGWTADSLDPGAFDITAAFAGGQLSGRAAINSYTGACTADADGAFSVGTINMTRMAGSEPAMRAESTYVRLLAEARAYRLSEGRLILTDANGNELLIFVQG